jgi:hypothetical protein
MKKAKDKIYSDFLTSLSVAWVSAGLINPLISKSSDILISFLISIFYILAGLVSLQVAVIFFENYEHQL